MIYIRQALPEDQPAVDAILHDFYAEMASSGFAHAPFAEGRQRILQSCIVLAFDSEANPECIGLTSWSVSEAENAAYGCGTFVRPTARRRRIALEMLREADRILFPCYARQLISYPDPHNSAALRMLDRAGFRRDRSDPKRYTLHGR